MVFKRGEIWIACMIGLCMLISACSNQHEGKPNILWIVSEDNSPLIGAYGDSLADTPNIDRLADRGILYENAFATTPVCAPARFTIITGTYANRMGTENMRSSYPVPDFVQFFPKYLREEGYYTSNNSKKDYNTIDQPDAWDESSGEAHYRNREEGQPFFHVQNLFRTHESQLHEPIDTLIHNPADMNVPSYHPDTETVRRDWARYYDLITEMDSGVGEILNELEDSGEAENTIIFYYSDHGGVLPRSKRFMFDSGLRVPMIVYIPPKFRDQGVSQGSTDRLISFVDLAPTVLSLAGIEPPDWMDGKAFLGEYASDEREFIYAYRGRMDERYDLTRAVRTKEYLYVHNYMQNRKYAQYLDYLWRSRTMQEWESFYEDGRLNDIQNQFFEPKRKEELYRVSEDPHNINNLAEDPEYREVLSEMRSENLNWLLTNRDLGFIPESRIDSLRGDGSLFDAVEEKRIPVSSIIISAEMASLGGVADSTHLADFLTHEDSSVRYWAARKLITDIEAAETFYDVLLDLVDDASPAVQISAAEALYKIGEEELVFDMVNRVIDDPNIHAQLYALNLLEALDIEELPDELFDKINDLYTNNATDENYVYRAASSLLDIE